MNQSKNIVNELNQASGVMKRALNELNAEGRSGFLSLEPEHFTGLMESSGQDRVFRTLGRLWSISKAQDEQVHRHAHTILESLAEGGVEPSMMEQCPVCDQPALKTFECNECGFSFIDDYKCPYLTEDGARKCMKVGKECTLFGLEFEECTIHSGGS